METTYPLNQALENDRGQFRIITDGEQGTFATVLYRRLPDGPYTEVYRVPSATQQEAALNHSRVIEAVEAGTLP